MQTYACHNARVAHAIRFRAIMYVCRDLNKWRDCAASDKLIKWDHALIRRHMHTVTCMCLSTCGVTAITHMCRNFNKWRDWVGIALDKLIECDRAFIMCACVSAYAARFIAIMHLFRDFGQWRDWVGIALDNKLIERDHVCIYRHMHAVQDMCLSTCCAICGYNEYV